MAFTTADDFRAAFTAFGDKDAFPSPEIEFWRTLGLKLHDATRWGDFLDEGVMLFVAHNVSLEFNARTAADSGQNPGQVVGALTSASVDKVSYSRDAASAMDPKNGHWNLSSYGIRWKWLQNIVGAGPVQIGVPSPGGNYSASAWPGPYPNLW